MIILIFENKHGLCAWNQTVRPWCSIGPSSFSKSLFFLSFHLLSREQEKQIISLGHEVVRIKGGNVYYALASG